MTASLDAAATTALLDFGELVDAVARATVEMAAGAIRCPERLVTPLAAAATMLSMPAAADDVAIHKLITVAPGNEGRGQPTIQGVMSVVDPFTGNVRMVLDGPTVTGRRTAAVSMLAIRLLAKASLRNVLLIGTGVQAGHHVAALAALHPAVTLRVRGSSPSSAAAFCAQLRDRFDDIAPARDGYAPDVVLTCTTSAVPVYREAASAATLVIATGSFRPMIAEIAPAVVRASTVCVDDPHGARSEAGDLLMAGVAWGLVIPLATLVSGGSVGRGPVVFKSVGCAAWDLAAARVALRAMRG